MRVRGLRQYMGPVVVFAAGEIFGFTQSPRGPGPHGWPRVSACLH